MSFMRTSPSDKWLEAHNLHLKPGDLVSFHDNDWLGGDKVAYIRGYGVILSVHRTQLWAEIMSDKKRVVELKYLQLIQELFDVAV